MAAFKLLNGGNEFFKNKSQLGFRLPGSMQYFFVRNDIIIFAYTKVSDNAHRENVHSH